jgi:hypothetical protein
MKGFKLKIKIPNSWTEYLNNKIQTISQESNNKISLSEIYFIKAIKVLEFRNIYYLKDIMESYENAVNSKFENYRRNLEKLIDKSYLF